MIQVDISRFYLDNWPNINNKEKSNELDEAENKETELDLNKDEPTISEENKEYDSDSVFAKLQELKKD